MAVWIYNFLVFFVPLVQISFQTKGLFGFFDWVFILWRGFEDFSSFSLFLIYIYIPYFLSMCYKIGST